MQDLLNKIDRLLKEKKFFEVKNIVKDENAADLAVLFDELFGEVFGEKTEFMILFRLLPKDLAAETFAHMNSDMQSHVLPIQNCAALLPSCLSMTWSTSSKKCRRTLFREF